MKSLICLSFIVSMGFSIWPTALAGGGAGITASSPKEPTDEVKLLIAALQNPGYREKVGAALKLGEKGADAVPAIPFLIDNLGDTRDGAPPGYYWSPAVYNPHSSALWALGKIVPLANGWGLNYATKKLADERVAVRTALLHTLALYGNEALTPILKVLRTDDSSQVLDAAADALGNLKAPAVAPLREILRTSQDSRVRAAAARALSVAGGTECLPDLIVAYEDSRNDGWAKGDIGDSLCSIADARAIDTLVSMIRNDTYPYEAVEALARIKDKKAVDAFFACLDDPQIPSGNILRSSLSKIDDPRAIRALVQAAASSDDRTRLIAFGQMGEKPDPTFVPILYSALKDKYAPARASAVRSIVKQKTDKRALFLKIVEGLDDSDRDVRREVTTALRSLTGRTFGEDKTKWMNWFEAFGQDFNWDR